MFESKAYFYMNMGFVHLSTSLVVAGGWPSKKTVDNKVN